MSAIHVLKVLLRLVVIVANEIQTSSMTNESQPQKKRTVSYLPKREMKFKLPACTCAKGGILWLTFGNPALSSGGELGGPLGRRPRSGATAPGPRPDRWNGPAEQKERSA
jgi:hypothetical protein